jgi:hypothetical protein
MLQKFFSLLRFAIDEGAPMPVGIKPEDWPSLFDMARQQTLVGVLYKGVSRMPAEMQPEKELAIRWVVLAERIATLNRIMNERIAELFVRFDVDGFRCCILKGQGNTLNYPDAFTRTPGDFDAWLDGGEDRIIRYVFGVNPDAVANYHHIDYPPYMRMPVEVHYKPSFQFNFVHNARIQKWFKDNSVNQFANKTMLPGDFGPVCVPTAGFNRVFQMSHIANHVLHEGLGLRQIMDYYFLLKQGFTEEERQEYAVLMKNFGLYKMARSVMYVLREVFGAGDDVLIVEPDERCGRMLLDEIMLSGNFGHFDERIDAKARKSRVRMNILRLKRDLRMLKYFPSECLSEPLFRIYHFFWRQWKNRDGLKPQ